MSNQLTGMWSFLKNKDFLHSQGTDYIFKRKTAPKLYVQIKASMIEEEGQVIVFMNDITRIKELEQISYKMRNMFFSSVAHELRTPLNSIIPMTRILLSLVKEERPLKYLGIILNSTLHLQNLIEDALDMSRIENDKFELIN